MSEDAEDHVKPSLTPAAEAALRARREREAVALRENLRRRKAQTRRSANVAPNRPAREADPCR